MIRRICPTCQTPNPAHEFFCNACGAPISSVEPTSDSGAGEPPPGVAPPTSPPRATGAAVAGGAPQCAHCGLEQAAATHCARCGQPMSGERRWFVAWPWGEETVLSAPLPIGRESSPEWLRDRYRRNGFDNLSRRHAVLDVDGETGHVVDLGSSNGTFVNGGAVSPHVRTALRAGDELRFASRLTIGVSLRTWP